MQLSEVVGVPNTIFVASQELLLVEVVISEGAIFTGAVVSETVTNCVAETVFPEPSVTCHITAVTPKGNEAGALFAGTKSPQLSVAEATPMETEQVPVTISGGRVIIGSSLSTTIIF